MSSTTSNSGDDDQPPVEKFLDFYDTYYAEDIYTLAQSFPKDERSLYVEYDDLYRFDYELAEWWREDPSEVTAIAEEALSDFDLPAAIDLSSAHVRLTDTRDAIETISISDLGSDHIGDLVAIHGQAEKVTKVDPHLEEGAFQCQRCGTMTYLPQGRTETSEPHECQGCERQGPFYVQPSDSVWVDQRKLKLGELPGERTTSRGQHRPVYVQDDLCHVGGENGLADRAGEQATVVATVRIDESSLLGKNATPDADIWLEAHSIVFDGDDHDVEIEEHRDAFEEFAAREDAIDLCRESIAPELLAEGDDELEAAMEASVAWLFNSYRIDPDGKGTFRGDLHFGLIGDPGTGKSTLLAALNELAPKSVFRSGTGLSKVGLTAAAVQEEFAGTSEWTLEPGVLPRANGGHCIIDEVDDVVDEKTKAIHDALEAEQMVKIDKAGIEADLPSRTALLASGNPTDGRFSRHDAIAPQIDLDPALISRMDILLSVQDIPDPDHDANVARHVVDSYDELSRAELAERGQQVEQPDESATEAPVPREVFRAWIAYARENVFPLLSDEAKERLEEFYVEVRDLNDGHSDDAGDEPVPATARTLEAGIRLATAFARVNLSETVTLEHANRAVDLSRKVVGMNYDPDSGKFDVNRVDTGTTKSQKDRKNAIRDTITELSGEENAERGEVVGTLVADGFDEDKIEKEIEELRTVGKIYEPMTGELRWTE